MPATPFLAVCFPNMKHSYEKQRAFVRDSLAEVNNLRKQLAEAEGNLQNHILSLV